MSKIDDERLKLLATGLNNMAVATVATTILAPVAGFLYGAPVNFANPWWWVIALGFFVLGIGLHFVASQWVLTRLQP